MLRTSGSEKRSPARSAVPGRRRCRRAAARRTRRARPAARCRGCARAAAAGAAPAASASVNSALVVGCGMVRLYGPAACGVVDRPLAPPEVVAQADHRHPLVAVAQLSRPARRTRPAASARRRRRCGPAPGWFAGTPPARRRRRPAAAARLPVPHHLGEEVVAPERVLGVRGRSRRRCRTTAIAARLDRAPVASAPRRPAPRARCGRVDPGGKQQLPRATASRAGRATPDAAEVDHDIDPVERRPVELRRRRVPANSFAVPPARGGPAGRPRDPRPPGDPQRRARGSPTRPASSQPSAVTPGGPGPRQSPNSEPKSPSSRRALSVRGTGRRRRRRRAGGRRTSKYIMSRTAMTSPSRGSLITTGA